MVFCQVVLVLSGRISSKLVFFAVRDSDEDPLPPKIRKATSVKKEDSSKANKSRRAIRLDSDEEEVVASKEVQQVKESPIKPKEKKATSALDFFGSTPVERESRETFANKRKQRSDKSEENEDSKVNRKEEYKNGREKEGRENGNVNHQTTEQPSKKRKEDFSESKSEVKKPSPEKKKEVLKTTPASKLAVKAATVPETPVRNSKPSTKKTVTSKKDTKMVVRKLQPKEHQRCQNQRKWLRFHPCWKRKNLAVVLWREMVLGYLVQKNTLRK
ncbi:nucleolar protein 58-like [Pocillopora verrucosa]|uniref:nucleolar protein 58-like n=1 Tax=Pocillopora verrucosa TaxID=203993 RepID=UPI00333F0B76